MPVELVLDVFILVESRVAKTVQRRKFPCTLSFRGGEYLGREESISRKSGECPGGEKSVPREERKREEGIGV